MNDYKEGDYNCDKCGVLGSFLDGTIFGIGKKDKDDLEICLCNNCLNNND